MKSLYRKAAAAALLLAGAGAATGGFAAEFILIDHTTTFLINIPDTIVTLAQDSVKYHYAHTSHGSQLRDGLYVIENNDPKYAFAYLSNELPQEEGDLCIYNGQQSDTYITPGLYWQTADGMDQTRAVLTANPEVNVSMWAWCSELNSYGESEVQAYLDSMSVLEAEFPSVTFVYMTGNAQATGSEGYNRYLRNEQIREFCRFNEKVIYDFADLDCWYYDTGTGVWDRNTYSYDGADVPAEHPNFYGDEASHTTWESCEQKGKALWYLSARLTGWAGCTDLRRAGWGSIKSKYREKGERSD
jgi:hypothetical protein